jgi:hypothetical protein
MYSIFYTTADRAPMLDNNIIHDNVESLKVGGVGATNADIVVTNLFVFLKD